MTGLRLRRLDGKRGARGRRRIRLEKKGVERVVRLVQTSTMMQQRRTRSRRHDRDEDWLWSLV